MSPWYDSSKVEPSWVNGILTLLTSRNRYHLIRKPGVRSKVLTEPVGQTCEFGMTQTTVTQIERRHHNSKRTVSERYICRFLKEMTVQTKKAKLSGTSSPCAVQGHHTEEPNSVQGKKKIATTWHLTLEFTQSTWKKSSTHSGVTRVHGAKYTQCWQGAQMHPSFRALLCKPNTRHTLHPKETMEIGAQWGDKERQCGTQAHLLWRLQSCPLTNSCLLNICEHILH